MRPDPNLEPVIDNVLEQQKGVSDALCGDGGRPWLNFKALGAKGKFDFEALHKALNRDASNKDYIDARQDPESKGADVALAKLSIDFLGGIERDTRMRQRTRIRMLSHSCARARGASDKDGPIRRNTIDWMERVFMKEAPPNTGGES